MRQLLIAAALGLLTVGAGVTLDRGAVLGLSVSRAAADGIGADAFEDKRHGERSERRRARSDKADRPRANRRGGRDKADRGGKRHRAERGGKHRRADRGRANQGRGDQGRANRGRHDRNVDRGRDRPGADRGRDRRAADRGEGRSRAERRPDRRRADRHRDRNELRHKGERRRYARQAHRGRPHGYRPSHWRGRGWRPHRYRPPFYRRPHPRWGRYHYSPFFDWYFVAPLATSTLVYVAALPDDAPCEGFFYEGDRLYDCDGVLYRPTTYRREIVFEIVSDESDFAAAPPAGSRQAPVSRGPLRLTSPMTRGPRVRDVQRELARLGYYRGGLDGVFGPRTEFALRTLQREWSVPATGVVDQETAALLGL